MFIVSLKELPNGSVWYYVAPGMCASHKEGATHINGMNAALAVAQSILSEGKQVSIIPV